MKIEKFEDLESKKETHNLANTRLYKNEKKYKK